MDWETGTMPPPARPCRMRKKRSASRFHACAQSIGAYGEEPKADQEEGFAAKPLGHKRARGQADGVGDQIGRHHPRGFVIADPHAAGEIGQHSVGDGCVEHLHEGRERNQDRDQPRACRGGVGGGRGAGAEPQCRSRADPTTARCRVLIRS